MADIKACWVRTAHGGHGWTELKSTGVDGKVATRIASMVDASTVLMPLGGEVPLYHHCNGVPDLLEETKNMRRRHNDPYGHDRLVEVASKVSPEGLKTVRERRVSLDAVYERTVTESPWVEVQRITCFCCSCGDNEGSDGLCRNHGYYGARPCEAHGVEGSNAIDPLTDEDLGMPESVQEVRRQQKEREQKGS